ncbi:MCE family protein [Nocardia puris]|uniref:Phospholipid/cholesterol/gamma-HCH transport system substrate-binding protein n=1 Tax=Nocardia puris TaxID=208602 RepID=A0A366DU26_9NOCA|nr:MCE family protein [Nocardia puris]MBF6210171.1 MCE family protein [Nocardia puris]MBF6367248.1 MCE family protein [Nocardia puris]MBF6457432.1 MCE family protein [Nocardia puris]RBO93587.1 phospholipid/cholesterol/gamma-HCH transport system substrate-binding protein [Nocardia puris]
MTSVRGAAWRLAVFAAAMVGVLVLIISAIQRPVGGASDSYDVLFTDANGLKTGDDVRMFGVQVGKVESIDLDGNQARVGITVRRSSPVYENSRFAIRYQNLTGQRYVDLQQESTPTGRTPAGSTIGTDRSIPSFDVTGLFNGLKPVLATLSPESLNQFGESMLAVIEGDGTGIGPALDAIGMLSTYATDRQQVISVLMRNLAEISDQIGGRSPHLVTLLGKVADVFTSLQIKVEGLIDFALTAPPVLDPVDSLLATLGLTEDANPDVDNIVRKLFPNPQELVEILSSLPGLIAGLRESLPAKTGTELSCSRGSAELPAAFAVLVAGQKVSVCNR